MSHLTQEQRYTISAMHQQGYKQIQIADTIGRDKSVISRELRRNADKRNGAYRYQLAQRKYTERLKAKPKQVKFTATMQAMVEERLCQKLSPEQIVGICRNENIPIVSAERIYQHVWDDKKKKGKLYTCLRTQGKRYCKRGSSKDSRGVIKDRVSIDERPEIVENKERFGDLETDTIIGKNNKGAIVTIADRATGLLKMKRVASKHAEPVMEATIEILQDWKPGLHTITADNGKEFTKHLDISSKLNVDFFFAHPYHSWERGANENLNGLIRQYIPKSSAFDELSDEYISFVEDQLNNRPRKRFNFKSPNQMFNLKVAFVT